MTGPLVAAQAAQPTVAGVVKVLSTDIVKVEGKLFRRVRKRIPLEKDGKILLTPKGRVRYTRLETLEPVDVSLHANPIGLGVLAVGAALGALVGSIAWNGVEIHSGLGNVTLVKGLKKTLQERSEDETANASCEELKAQYDANWWNPLGRAIIVTAAKGIGCEWAQGL